MPFRPSSLPPGIGQAAPWLQAATTSYRRNPAQVYADAALSLRVLQESQIECCEHHDNTDVRYEPFPGSIPKDEHIDANDSGYHGHNVNHDRQTLGHSITSQDRSPASSTVAAPRPVPDQWVGLETAGRTTNLSFPAPCRVRSAAGRNSRAWRVNSRGPSRYGGTISADRGARPHGMPRRSGRASSSLPVLHSRQAPPWASARSLNRCVATRSPPTAL